MPTLVDYFPVGRNHDGRRKITDEQRQEIRRLYEVEQQPIRRIAATTGVSRRSVQFILFPERAQKVKDRAKEVKRWEKYNTPEYQTPAMRKNRAKKKLLLKTGLVTITPETLTKYETKLKEQKRQRHEKRKRDSRNQ